MSTISEINEQYLQQYKTLLQSKANYARHLSIKTELAELQQTLDQKVAARDQLIANNGSAAAIISLDHEILDLEAALVKAKQIEAAIDWKRVLSEEEKSEFTAGYCGAVNEVVMPKLAAVIQALTTANTLLDELTEISGELDEFTTATKPLQASYISYPSFFYVARAVNTAVEKAIRDFGSFDI